MIRLATLALGEDKTSVKKNKSKLALALTHNRAGVLFKKNILTAEMESSAHGLSDDAMIVSLAATQCN